MPTHLTISVSSEWLTRMPRNLPSFWFSAEIVQLFDLKLRSLEHSYPDDSLWAEEELSIVLTRVEDHFMDFIIQLVKWHAKNSEVSVIFPDDLIDAIITDSEKSQLQKGIKLRRARFIWAVKTFDIILSNDANIEPYTWSNDREKKAIEDIIFCVNQYIDLLNGSVNQ